MLSFGVQQQFAMQKIHRRKNEQITKQFPCTEGCGKAYGSYAALYTHVKNKHSNVKPPQMKSGLIKIKEGESSKKAPQEKQRIVVEPNHTFDCKSCKKIDCTCEEQIDSGELDQAITLMSDQTYIKFINLIGLLHYNDKAGWVRSTEDSFEFVGRDRLRDMVYEFNVKYGTVRDSQVILSNKWVEYLSYTSRFIDRAFLLEFYNSIFLIMSKENSKDIEQLFETMGEFDTVRKSIEARQKQWTEFIDFIKAI